MKLLDQRTGRKEWVTHARCGRAGSGRARGPGAARATRTQGLAGGANLLGGHDAERDQDGDQQQFLHRATLLPTARPATREPGEAR